MLKPWQPDAQDMATTIPLTSADPLYKRAPREDEDGRALTDFMMVIPRLKHKPQRLIQSTVGRIEEVLVRHGDHVVFADLNLKINVLWVVTKPIPGICLDLPVALNNAVPEALLVAQPRFY